MTKDKKQLLVVGLLVLVVLAIGAFQFMGPKSKPVAAGKEKQNDEQLVAEGNVTKDPMGEYINKLIATSSTPRDPFAPQAVLIDNEPQVDPNIHVAPQQGDPGNTMPGPEITGDPVRPYVVDPLVQQGGNNSTVVPINDGSPYALRGVMIGKQRLCMLEMSDGRQMLVAEGQSFGKDNETTVVQITDTHVVFRHRGNERALALLGGN